MVIFALIWVYYVRIKFRYSFLGVVRYVPQLSISKWLHKPMKFMVEFNCLWKR